MRQGEGPQQGSDAHLGGETQSDQGSRRDGVPGPSVPCDPDQEVEPADHEQRQQGIDGEEVAQLYVDHGRGDERGCDQPHPSAVGHAAQEEDEHDRREVRERGYDAAGDPEVL